MVVQVGRALFFQRAICRENAINFFFHRAIAEAAVAERAVLFQRQPDMARPPLPDRHVAAARGHHLPIWPSRQVLLLYTNKLFISYRLLSGYNMESKASYIRS